MSIILFLIVFGAKAESYFVSNKPELETAVNLAQPGDNIVIKNKVWTGVDFILTCNGSANQPITICPETPGGASLEAGSRIEIGGDYLVVSGFKIVNGSNANNAIRFSANGDYAFHSRLTDCLIDDWGPSNSTTKIHWVVLYGGYNRVDHCQFTHMNHQGVTLMVKAGADQVGHHQIDHNYFGSKPDGPGNGYETIKMGGGDYSMYPLNTTVEKNYFYRCDGEVELISNKSWENIYRYNTFFECQGTITLRFGRECIVEGNYFLGNGVSNTGGIRITDQDHLIINNYFENLEGENARAAISIMSGIPDIEGGNSGHSQTKNARILHNTIINCKESINMGYLDEDDLGDPRGELTAPENCTIANNIIWSSHAPLIKEDSASINTKWHTNMAYGADIGNEPDSGIFIQNPELKLSASGVWIIEDGSPVINKGTILTETVIFDFEKQMRADGMPDIGADELSDEQVDKLPITQADVGLSWDVATHIFESKIVTKSIQVYPNPCNQKFHISIDKNLLGSDIKMEIFDLSGKVKHSELISNLYSNPEITVNQLKGFHIVRLTSSIGIFYAKIIFNL